MKIALIRQKYTPFGGAERYMARLVERLLADGHEVHIFTSQWDADAGAAVTLHRVPVIRASSWLRALSFAINCRRLIKREDFDLVFSLERTLFQDVYRAGDGCHRRWLLQKNLGKGPLARLATYLNPLHITYLYLERRLFAGKGLKAVIANSRLVRDDITAMYGVPPEKVHLVYNGLDAATFDLSRRQACRDSLAEEYVLRDELRILYVGSGFERKGVPALIRAAARLIVPFRLFIVGKGDIGKYRRLAQRLGIGDKVTFTGPVRDVARYYLGCDVFAFPTLYDPFSNATLEAMACGLPVVTTPFNGVSELIKDGRNGLLVADPLADENIAEAILRLAPEDERLRMGEEARRTASGFTMERNVRETMDVIAPVSGR